MDKNIKYIHELINDILEKEVGEYHAPEKIDRILHTESLDLFQSLRRRLGTSEEVDSMLSPFTLSKTLTVETTGFFALPEDIEFLNLIQVGRLIDEPKTVDTEATYKEDKVGIDIDLLTSNQWSERLRDPLVGPELDFPIAIRLQKNLKVAPIEVKEISIIYLKTPSSPTYAVRRQGELMVYDGDNSVDMEWSVGITNDLVNRALGKLGISQREGEIVQYSEMKRQTEST
jgi:hypothetical protein